MAVTHGPAGGPVPGAAVPGPDACCEDATATTTTAPDERWLRSARYARWLAWASLAWMAAEGLLGLVAGVAAGSIALVGWAVGIAVTAASVIIMPVLGIAKHRLGERLGSGATAGEGTQNLMCAAQAAAVLLALAVVAIWPSGWPVDPIIALGIAGWSVWEGSRSWRGADCC